MGFLAAIILILMAGGINGSFAMPTKYMTKWSFETIWLTYAVVAFLLIPWGALWLLNPHALFVYTLTPPMTLFIMAIGGLLFGIGQVGFAFGIHRVGIGLAFTLNIGLGTVMGFLLPLIIQHPNEILTPTGECTLVGAALIIASLVCSYYAGHARDQEAHKVDHPLNQSKHDYRVGILLCLMAGLCSAGQNLTFSLTHNMQVISAKAGASPLVSSGIIWPGFLVFTFIPYALYMLFLMRKNHSFSAFKNSKGLYYILALVMGACWYGSLILYSKAAQLIGKLGPVLGWPMFMALIILTSSFWGIYHKEWHGSAVATKLKMYVGIMLMVLAIVVLSIGTALHG